MEHRELKLVRAMGHVLRLRRSGHEPGLRIVLRLYSFQVLDRLGCAEIHSLCLVSGVSRRMYSHSKRAVTQQPFPLFPCQRRESHSNPEEARV